LLGLPAGTFGGTFRAFLHQVHPDDRPALQAALARGAREGADYAGEFRVRWPDGSLHWIAGRAGVLRDAAGRPTRMIGVGLDITDQLRQARLEGVLLAARTAQHALNNQLATVVGYADLLAADRGLPTHLRQLAEEILVAAQEAAARVERLRQITRLHEVDQGGPGPVLDLSEASGRAAEEGPRG
jgi:signal transduction histidine kinase